MIYYFDNGATSNPKPESVYLAVNYAMRELNANPGRGGHFLAVKSASEIYSVRKLVADFFNLDNPLNVVFTKNSTESLNIAILGTVDKNSKILTSEIEHNSVLRPLFSNMEKIGYQVDVVSEDKLFETLKKGSYTHLVLNHMSNVIGKTIDIEVLGKVAREKNTLFILDVSQSAGVIPVDMKKQNIDIACFTGHKSLFAIQGIGGMVIREGVNVNYLISGGTGSHSTELHQPQELPEKLESGTLNTPGIVSLGAGIKYINEIGLDNIYEKEHKIKEIFLNGLEKLNKKYGNIIEIFSDRGKNSGPVVSIRISGMSSSDLSAVLDEDFGIITRSGLHCAPLIHKRLGSVEGGLLRFSFGYFNSEEDIIYALDSLESIVNQLIN